MTGTAHDQWPSLAFPEHLGQEELLTPVIFLSLLLFIIYFLLACYFISFKIFKCLSHFFPFYFYLYHYLSLPSPFYFFM